MNKLEKINVDDLCLNQFHFRFQYPYYPHLRFKLMRNVFSDYLYGGPYRVKEELT